MVIICILWAFVGFAFTSRYLKADWLLSLFGTVLAVVLIVQIERQVILSSKTNRIPLLLRGIIAGIMAIIGSMIIDQIIFKEDIEKQKIKGMNDEVNRVFPGKAHELSQQISYIDSTILHKENERKDLVNDLTLNPVVPVYAQKVTRKGMVGSTSDSSATETVERTSTGVPNPKMALIEPLDKQIEGLRKEKIKKDSMLLVLRPIVEAELKEHIGFLDELNLMLTIFSESKIALIAWLLWFLLLFGLEIFILVSKVNDTETDYDAMLAQQMDLHYKRISLLGKQ